MPRVPVSPMPKRPANDNDARSTGETKSEGRRCPICGKPAAHEVRPFCSKRCADVDLHRWLGGAYAIPAEDETPEPPFGRDAD